MNALVQIETNFLLWIQQHGRMGWLTPLMQLFSHLGDKGLFWIALTLLLLCLKRTRRLGAYCAVSMALTFLVVNVAVKPLVARIRPYDLVPLLRDGLLVAPEHDFSFPSGHAANSFAVAWIIFRMTERKYGVPAVTLASLISISRLYVSVHYPSDVVCGILIAICLAELTLWQLPRLERKLFPKKRRRRKSKSTRATQARAQSETKKAAESPAAKPRREAS